MRTIFFLLFCVLVSSLGAKEYKVRFGPNGLPYEGYRIVITFLPLDKLQDGGTVTLRNTGSEFLTGSVKTQNFFTRTNVPHIDGGYERTYQVQDPTVGTPERSYTIDVSSSWAGGQFQQPQFADTFVREVVATNRPGVQQPVYIRRTVIIYPPGFVTAQYNLLINTRSRPVAGVDYLIKWEDEEARTWSVPAGNPPYTASSFFPSTLSTTEPAAPRGIKVWRRMQGFESWVLIADTTCPPEQTIILNDFPDEPTPPVEEDPENPSDVPDTANQVNSSGAQTGNQVSTGGTGINPLPGSGGGGGGIGGGGDGDGLTQAEVQQAVRDGVKQAANDSTGGAGTYGIDGLLEHTDIEEETSTLQGRALEFVEGVQEMSASGASIVTGYTNYTWPSSVGSGSLVHHLTLPVLGALTVDLTPYEFWIGVLRSLMLAVMTTIFIYYNASMIRSLFQA